MANRYGWTNPAIFHRSPVIAGFSTRGGGSSSGYLSTLNLSLSVGDDPEIVTANRKAFFGSFGLSLDELATAGQIHDTNVEIVNAAGFYPETDGLVTRVPGVALCLTAADCASVLIADCKNGVVGACHAGWKGAVGGIVPKTVQKMLSVGADPASMKTYIGPCISVANFEVGEEVASQFPSSFVDRSFDKPHVDLSGTLRQQLLDAGVANSDIEVSDRCTYAEIETFFSHRAENGKTGRMMAFIALENEGTTTDENSG